MRWVGDERLYNRSLELLLSQSKSAFLSTAIAGFILIYTFWHVSSPLVSVVWCVSYGLLASYRIYLRLCYNKEDEGNKEQRAPLYFLKLGVCIFITGVLWGSFIVYLAGFANGALAAILVANLAFLLAGAVTAYAISLPIFVSFSFPIVVPAVIYLVLSFDSNLWLLAAVSLGWYLFMLSTARRFGEFAMRALGYEYENTELVSELEEQNKRAEILAQELIVLSNTDSLTGIFNRRYFDECLANEVVRSQRTNTSLSLILCDVDFFKIYNDTLGHVEGDKCLKQVAQILQHSVREGTDVVARYGGEEFAIILTNTDISQAKVFAERLRRSISQKAIPHPRSTVSSNITISIGLSCMKEGESVGVDIVERADRALYMAKECGRDQVQVL